MAAALTRMEAPIRRKLAGLASLLVVFAACSSGTERHLEELYDKRVEGTSAG